MEQESSPILDTFDVDLVVKILSHTLFSPFFIFFVPMFYRALGAPWDAPTVMISSIYFVILSMFWTLHFLSKAWRNNLKMFMRPRRFDWGEQIVLVTGGASGIGELLANTLAVRNVPVVVLDVNRIVTENYNIAYYQCDVSDFDQVEAVSKKIIEEIGHPTVIVNNAGIAHGKLLLDLSPDEIKRTFNSNLLAHFWTLKVFLPGMIKAKAGHIVTVGSVMGLVGAARVSDYAASKAALVNLHESLRYELDKKYHTPEIRTTLVLPGHTMTRMFDSARFPQQFWFKFLAPSLPPYTIAKSIIAALDSEASQTIYLPFYVNFVRWVGCLPSYGRDFFQWLSGADDALDNFVPSYTKDK